VVNTKTKSITHIDIKSQPERHIINRSELAVIAVALKQENTEDYMSILTYSSFCINTIHNHTIDLEAYKQHLHKDLLQLTNQLLRERDSKQMKTHTEEVKSHTDVGYNETDDEETRGVLDGEIPPGITFQEADPPLGGIRT